MEAIDDTTALSTASPFLIEIADRGDMNELARHIRECEVMFDPDHADLVRRACLGSGEHSKRLRAIVGDGDGLDEQPVMPPVGYVLPPLSLHASAVPQSQPMNWRQARKANPFKLPDAVTRSVPVGHQDRRRSAVLTDEAVKLYKCLSFAMHKYGVVMNGHMTVVWSAFGIRDHARAALVLTEFNARMAKWVKVNGTGRKRKGIKAETWGVPERYFYAFIHENTRDRGFHTHQLFSVNYGKSKAFAERAVQVLKRLTGASYVPADAVVFRPWTKGDGFAPYLPRFKKNEVERCWIWFRYLAKNLSPHEFTQVGDQCALLRDVFRIKRPFVLPQPVTCSELFGCSQYIGIGEQKKAGFVSRFDNGDWQHLYNDWDLRDWHRCMEQQRRDEEMQAMLENIRI